MGQLLRQRLRRSLEPQLATPIQIPELLAGKTMAAALPAVLATWLVWVGYGLINAAIADPRLLRMVFSPQWIVAMASLVPLICVLSVLLGVIVSSRVGDPRTAQQFGAFVVLPIIAIAVAIEADRWGMAIAGLVFLIAAIVLSYRASRARGSVEKGP